MSGLKMSAAVAITLLLFCLQVSHGEIYDYTSMPQQIHIAYGETPTSMLVVWSTRREVQDSIVEYGETSAHMSARGVQKRFVGGENGFNTQYIHTVNVEGLTPGEKYMYRCGSSLGWSPVYSFTAMPQGSDWSPRIAVYGDMGYDNARSLPRLLADMEEDMYDAVFHVGDFAYDMHTDNSRVGDAFMRQIEPIAANLPYMTCPGNHEAHNNFSNYKSRFAMPTDINGDNMYYSFDIGPAHIISFSSEYYFSLEYGEEQISRQYGWLKKDLEMATSPDRRRQRPWVITMAHRPMYCSNTDHDDCTNIYSIVRTGELLFRRYGLEDLFYEYGVDLMIWAHEHSYERLWPVYNRIVYNGTTSPYVNPPAPVNIITGSAGCGENHDYFIKHPEEWSAFHSTDYGYTRMNILNNTHLYMEQVSDDKGGAIIDNFMLVKESHGRYPIRD